MSNHLSEYREHLVKADQKSQEDFDKTLLTVATSSLGVSLVFVRDLVGERPVTNPIFLIAAWIFLAASVGCVLLGFYFSRFALRKAMKQIDRKTIDSEHPGGKTAYFVEILNALGGIFLVLGFAAIITFVSNNLPTAPHKGGKMTSQRVSAVGDQDREQVTPTPTKADDDVHKGDGGYSPPPPPPPQPASPTPKNKE